MTPAPEKKDTKSGKVLASNGKETAEGDSPAFLQQPSREGDTDTQKASRKRKGENDQQAEESQPGADKVPRPRSLRRAAGRRRCSPVSVTVSASWS